MYKYLSLVSSILLSFCTTRPIALPDPTQVNPATEAPAIVQTPDIQLEAISSLAITDLSKRLSLDPDLIQVLSVEPIEWPDSSIGCPRQGEVYTQSTVAGYQILFEASGQIYEYHSQKDETLILCDSLTEENARPIEIDNVEDGWPNETRDKDVIFVTPGEKP